jgi:hypothetical protein
MEIDFSKLTTVFNAMFTDIKQYQYMPNSVKEKNFFIFNRYFSKRYPMYAQQLNVKNITNKAAGMDLMHYFIRQELMRNKTNPQYWFWSKSPFEKIDKKITKEDEILMENLDITSYEDLKDLKKLYPDFVKEEMEYVKFIMKTEK